MVTATRTSLAATLLLLLQLIWLIVRGNLSTLRMLAESADRFAQGDHSARIKADAAGRDFDYSNYAGFRVARSLE